MAQTEEEKAAKRKAYWKTYWDRKKGDILKSRKDRYANDSSYREAVLDQSRKKFEKRRKGRKQPVPGAKARIRSRFIQMNDEPVEVFNIGAFAHRTGYDVATIRSWVKNGIIPAPTQADSVGRLWFSDEYIKFMDEMLTKHRDDGWELNDFSTKVKAEWNSRQIV